MDILGMFHEDTARWFAGAIGEPTEVQRAAWPAIAEGGHVLVSAPTGTGKTLAAFLVWIDQLKRQARQGTLEDKLQVLYISPLKALGNDIRENLKRPLEGIGGPEIRTAVRTGDTSASDRQKMLRRPPHILITTPESLYLLLTSTRGREMLSTTRAVILDELHVMLDNKRGAHLMLSLARLDALCGSPLQRIGLSATIRPLSLAAEYLAHGEPVRVIAPPMKKRADMQVNSVLPDMRIMTEGSIWPDLCRAVYDQCRGMRTVIAFLEGRAAAEKLARGVNELAGEGFARTHHGSVSREQRQEAEEQLRSGKLRLLCATSSMELGIDVGEVDLVLQIGCPLTVSGALQRMGRAGHSPGRISVMHIFPRTAAEGVPCALTADAALAGEIEPAKPPQGCYDVLAQHLVSMAVDGGYRVEDALALVRRTYNFKAVTHEKLCAILAMLAGDYEHELDRPVRPRLLYDRIHGVVQGDSYSRMLALSAGGTIPDKGMFPAYLADGTRLGELDEEFVFEARVGDKFLLGAFAWRITDIRRDRVIVSPTNPEGAQAPFWRGETLGRAYDTALRFGARLRMLGEAYRAGRLEAALVGLHMDDTAARNAARTIREQVDATGCLPDDRTILAEHFSDQAGEHQLMIHSVFGRRVNYALSLLIQREATRAMGVDVRVFDDDDGILLYGIGGKRLPGGLLYLPDPEEAEGILRAMLPATALFSMAFRYNAARALMMGVRSGRRQPLWVQRMRGAETLSAVAGRWEHPLMEETLRECLEDYLDLDGLRQVLGGVRSGAIQVREMHLDAPSPMALPLRRQMESALMYDYSPIPASAKQAAQQALELQEGVKPEPGLLEAQGMRNRQPANVQQLHTLLMTEGDLTAGETEVPIEWLEELAAAGRALYIEPGLWIAAEEAELYEKAMKAGERPSRLRLARRCLRYRGPQDGDSLSERYCWPVQVCIEILETLRQEGAAVQSEERYYHHELYAQAQRQTVMARRQQARTLPPERYAAMMARRIRRPGRPEDQLKEGLEGLLDIPYPIALWEDVLLPARCDGYRPAMLDALLAQGELFWQIHPGEKPMLSFHRYEDIDWDAKMPEQPLTGDEQTILTALEKRGASFAHTLAPLLGARPVIDVLISLAMKGMARADSLVPLRQWAAMEDGRNRQAKRVAKVRVMAQQAGRWELSRPLKVPDEESLLLQDFARQGVLCRETAGRVPWNRAMELLRVWEYTGQARRGYFVAGLSGAQFILNGDYARITAALQDPGEEALWLNAADPLQCWGKALSRGEGMSFQTLPGTAICLIGGRPVAILSRQGEVLRLLQPEAAGPALAAFARDFAQRHIFPWLSRILIRQYPKEAESALMEAGFTRDMMDWTLWRSR